MHHLYAAIRKWIFWQVFGYWGILFLVSDLVNEFIIRSWLLTDMVQALLGIFLLFFPSWPVQLGWRHSEKNCRRIIRFAAVLEIAGSFLIRRSF